MGKFVTLRRLMYSLTIVPLCLASIGFAQTTKKMTQLAHLKLSKAGNAGIWGWVAPDGSEYALPTTRSGVAVVSLKDPKNPKELFHLDSPQGNWHELLTVRNYLYKCAEQGRVGMQIWDLSPLPNAKPKELAGWMGVSTCHSLWSDTLVTPHRLYVEGSNDTKILSLANPAKPVLVGTIKGEVHDGMARGGRVFISTGNRKTVDIFDATDPARPQLLGRAAIGEVSRSLGEPAGYSHNIWLTDDNRYAFTTEETNGCTVKMWDISDIKSPKFTGGKYLAGRGMAHNAYIRKHLLYLSHYGMGIRVIDFKDPKNLVEVAFHNPGGSSWGCFPWLPSGLIIHGNGGLRVVEPDADIKIVGKQVVSISGRHSLGGFKVNALREGISYQLPGQGRYTLSILNPMGRELHWEEGTGAVGLRTLDMGRQWPSGNYLVRLHQGQEAFTAPVTLGR